MSKKNVIIAIDAMGGDNAPYKNLKGTEIFLKKNKNIKTIFLGSKIR